MDTKGKILKRTAELFLLMGAKSLTMDFIANDLGISKRTIYELFSDKEELLQQAVGYNIQLNNRKMLKIVDQTDNVIDAIFVMMEDHIRLMRSINPVVVEDLKKYIVQINASYFANKEKCRELSLTNNILERGIREGIFRDDLKIDVVDTFIYELVNLIHNSKAIRLMNLTRQEALNNIFLPYLRGICTEKGLDLMKAYVNESKKNNY